MQNLLDRGPFLYKIDSDENAEIKYMLKRKIYDSLLEWKKMRKTEHVKKGLLIRGARQVGVKVTIPHYFVMFL